MAYDPAKRTFCADPAQWKQGRRVRVLHDAYDLRGKIGEISGVGSEFVFVRVRYSKRLGDQDVIAYLPSHLRLLDRKKS